MIGTNLDLIKSLITEEIKNQWMILCFNKLSPAKRPKRQILSFWHLFIVISPKIENFKISEQFSSINI
jgi:hypothetical protein